MGEKRRSPRVDLDRYRRDGFAVVRDVFSKDEVARFRELLCRVRDRERELGLCLTDPEMPANVRVVGDLLGKDELREVDYLVLDPRVVECARQALGKTPFYFGDADYQTGEGERGLHRDNADRDDLTGPDWSDNSYSLVRIGLYLQDHESHSGGLQVKPGSHVSPPPRFSRSEHMRCTEGDLALWNLRIVHSGNFVRARGIDMCLPPTVECRIPRSLRVPEEKERVAIFITFGVRGDHHTDHYIDWWRGRDDRLDHWRRSGRGADLDALARRRGVEIAYPTADYGSECVCRRSEPALAAAAAAV